MGWSYIPDVGEYEFNDKQPRTKQLEMPGFTQIELMETEMLEAKMSFQEFAHQGMKILLEQGKSSKEVADWVESKVNEHHPLDFIDEA
jgi:hypothetical protein